MKEGSGVVLRYLWVPCWFQRRWVFGLGAIVCLVFSRGRLVPLVGKMRRLYRDSLTPSRRLRDGSLAMLPGRVLCLAWVASFL